MAIILLTLILSCIPAFASSRKVFIISTSSFIVSEISICWYQKLIESRPSYHGTPGDAFVPLILAFPIILFIFSLSIRLCTYVLSLLVRAYKNKNSKAKPNPSFKRDA